MICNPTAMKLVIKLLPPKARGRAEMKTIFKMLREGDYVWS